MATTKRNLLQFQTITNGNMTGDLTSIVTNIQFLDNPAYQFNFTGSPTGTFAIEVSVDYVQDAQGNVTNAGNWTPLPLGTTPPPDTSGGSPLVVELNQMSVPWLRATYTATSGTGTLNAFITAKML